MTSSGKSEIRAAALARRATVPTETRAAFADRLAVVGPSLVRPDADPLADPCVALFLPIRDEPDTRPLIGILDRIGLATALPVAGSRDEPLLFRRWTPGAPLTAGRFGLQHPRDDAIPAVPAVLFVPLAAFDRRGARIGYGGGYYDRTLAGLRRGGPVRAIGVAFACQEELFIPTDDHDQPLDLVITERDVILCEA